jgi:hypothetical protein
LPGKEKSTSEHMFINLIITTPLSLATSVADLGCLSRILYPDFYPSLIPDPDLTTATKEEGNFLTATNMSKIKIIFFLNRYIKNLSQFTKNFT